jgi:multiple sugar transport system substrate-binding protein
VPGLTDDDFKNLLQIPLKNKYPHITLEMMRPGKGQQMADLITAGQIPDLMYGNLPLIKSYSQEFQVIADLTPFIKRFNMDLSRFEPLLVETVQELSGEGAMFSIPFSQNSFGLWYNKNIFDKFGVEYPKDGMFWEDAISLAVKLTRKDGGTQYRGLDIFNQNIGKFGASLSINWVDPNTERAVVPEKWGEVFRLAMAVYNIPGNKPEKLAPNVMNAFFNEQILAMAPSFSNAMIGRMSEAESIGLHWDVAQPPSFKEAPNTGYRLDVHQFFVSNATKYKDQAFQVIEYATSDEIQLMASKTGKLPALVNSNIRKQYAADLPYVKGKNIQSLFKSNSARLPYDSKYNDIVDNAVNQAFEEVFAGKADINTALRQAEENANKKIKEEKNATGGK